MRTLSVYAVAVASFAVMAFSPPAFAAPRAAVVDVSSIGAALDSAGERTIDL